jgi:phosphoglycolate phosphatase
LKKIDRALYRFNTVRKHTLTLYHGAAETLAELQRSGVKIVGHTEAVLANSYWRLRALGIEKYFTRLYTLEGRAAIHISPESRWTDPPEGFVTVVPRDERKPNPRLLRDICKHEGAELISAYYLGDSLVRDVAMAKQAGMTSIWARYGTRYDPECWKYLVKITHWSDDDVRREKDLKVRYGNVIPDYAIDSFSELKTILLKG